MDKLLDGVKKFRSKDFMEYKQLFTSLESKQRPHTLFIGCCDSRINPYMITNTVPGELFVIRNIANIVPYYREVNEFLAATSAIEYAVKVLKVSNIIVCGHSNCGGCNAFYLSEEELNQTPHTKKWVELSKRVSDEVRKDSELMEDVAKREWVTEQMNVVEQINHLLTYPYIEELYNAGELNIYGWHYIIHTGVVYNYDKETNTFEKIE